VNDFKRSPKATLLMVIQPNSSIFYIEDELVIRFLPLIVDVDLNASFAPLNIIRRSLRYQEAKFKRILNIIAQNLHDSSLVRHHNMWYSAFNCHTNVDILLL
jgi:hypothetical protein